MKGFRVIPLDADNTYVPDLYEFAVDVLENDKNVYLVIDADCKRVFRTNAESYENAIANYVDWAWGMVRLWVWDEEEQGYVKSDNFVKASTRYEYKREFANWELVD